MVRSLPMKPQHPIPPLATEVVERLCSEAKGGQILVSSRVAAAIEEQVDCEEVGALTLKGLLRPVPTFNVVGAKRR
jgi:adenylate cyclase